MPDQYVDLIVTDPPYDVDYKNKSTELARLGRAREKQIERDKGYVEWDINYGLFAYQLFRVLKQDAHCYIFCGDKQIVQWTIAMENVGFKFRNYLVWVKNNTTFDLSRGYKYCYSSEICLFFAKGNKKLNKLGLSNVMKHNIVTGMKHPTIKPVDLIRNLITNSSDEGDVVLDPFMGSGTTAVACKQINRKYIGFELNSLYVDVANDRLGQDILVNYIPKDREGGQDGL